MHTCTCDPLSCAVLGGVYSLRLRWDSGLLGPEIATDAGICSRKSKGTIPPPQSPAGLTTGPDGAKATLLAVFCHLLEATGLKLSFLPENLLGSTFTLYPSAVG